MLDPRDQAYIEAEPDPELREIMRCAVTTYRQPDALGVGDPVPALALTRLDMSGTINLGDPRSRPLVLFFGSYT